MASGFFLQKRRFRDTNTSNHVIVLVPSNKPEQELFIYRKIPDGCWPLGVKGPKSTKFNPRNYILARHLDLVHEIWTKFGMNIGHSLRYWYREIDIL